MREIIKNNLESKVKPWDYFDEEKHVSDEIFTKRYSICQECPQFFKPTKQCKLCLCIMPAKAKLEEADCPLKKWDIIKNEK